MCTRLGEVVPRSLDEGPFFRRRRSLRGAALRGVMCDKNVMFLLFFCSPKIDVRNKGISLPAAFFCVFRRHFPCSGKDFDAFGPPERPPSTLCKDGALISAVLMIPLKLHLFLCLGTKMVKTKIKKLKPAARLPGRQKKCARCARLGGKC